MRLNNEQIAIIRKELEAKGLSYGPLKTELLDEVCTAIETEMEKGLSFDSASSNITGDIGERDISLLQKNMIRALMSGRRLGKYRREQSLWIALALILWVVLEYIVGRITGVYELGPLYGLLSLVIIFSLIFRSLKSIRTTFFEGAATLKALLVSGFRMSLLSSLVVSGFLLLFWTYVYPDFYSTFQLNPDDGTIHPNQFLVGSLIGMGVSVVILGCISSLISAFLLRIRSST